MRIGFTGTREGMTVKQKEGVVWILDHFRATEGHHGDCVGADAEFHELCRTNSVRTMIGHPPTNPKLRAFCEFDEEREPRPYLERNRDIVFEAELMIGCPKEYKEVVRARGQGTWSTIRYARDVARKWIFIIYPGGSVVVYNEN